MLVVMTDVDPEDAFEVPSVHDQDPVETFAADGADPPFDEGVRARCAYGVDQTVLAAIRIPSPASSPWTLR